MTTDILSDVLRAVRLTGSVYFDFDLTAPWVAEAPAAQEIAKTVMPGAQRVIECHLIARGDCWGHAIGDAPRRLHEGDFIMFPQGDAHVLSSAPGMRAAPNMTIYTRPSTRIPIVHQMGGGERSGTRLVCCFLGCDERPFNPLLDALPRVMHLAGSSTPATTGWLATLLHMAARESGSDRPGSENVLARLSELLFVEAIRAHLTTMPSSETGWLAGLRDPVIARALGALHHEPQADWTVERLARITGTSRSGLAERFTGMVGHPPMYYLALWRMQLASRLLSEGGQVASVATAVGYESEAAFSRAFKKLVGYTPAAWKQRPRRFDTGTGPQSN